MAKSICILGRQPALGLAELESLYGADNLQPLGDQAALLAIDPQEVAFNRLGGSVKLAKLLTVLDTTDWNKLESYLKETVTQHTRHLPEGKMSLGLSTYGLSVKPNRVNATGLELKKVIKATGRPVRVVPNKTPDLSSAQVLHNKLTDERSWELLLIKHGNKAYLAQTTNVQDINAYAERDQKRPKRDARVGMLPPKLAQIIVNLATAETVFQKNHVVNAFEEEYELPFDVSDPFCGTGVLLQEALLMGYSVYGGDKDARMCTYTTENLQWIADKFHINEPIFQVYIADATDTGLGGARTIACETYLGRPFSALPAPDVLNEVMRDVDTIHRKFLQNVARQTKPGFRMCIAIPAWKTPSGFKHLKVLDSLEELGYTRSVFTHVETRDLVYHRPDQIVARELVVLIRK